MKWECKQYPRGTMKYTEIFWWKSNSCMKKDLLAQHVSLGGATCSRLPASCFSEDLCDEQTCHGGENSLEARTRANDRQEPSVGRRDFKPSLFQFAINNNKIPVSATGKSKSLDLFQRKHDKQAIQRLKRVRKAQKTTRHCSQHLEQRSTMGNPFSICSTRAHWICMSSLLIRVFISALMHSKGFEWLVNTAPCKD